MILVKRLASQERFLSKVREQIRQRRGHELTPAEETKALNEYKQRTIAEINEILNSF